MVEKTCANSLRVPFVDAVVPEAKFIFIYRDGIDVTVSAKARWTAELDISYVLKKIRYVPILDLPYYSIRYLWARIYRFTSNEQRLPFWGPALDDMQTILKKHSLNEICALQWKHCVDNAEKAFSSMPASKVLRVRYEDLVCHPVQELQRILKHIDKEVDIDRVINAVENVSPQSIGKGRSMLSNQEIDDLESLVGQTLKRYGYL